jgi:hypothetical protein
MSAPVSVYKYYNTNGMIAIILQSIKFVRYRYRYHLVKGSLYNYPALHNFYNCLLYYSSSPIDFMSHNYVTYAEFCKISLIPFITTNSCPLPVPVHGVVSH